MTTYINVLSFFIRNDVVLLKRYASVEQIICDHFQDRYCTGHEKVTVMFHLQRFFHWNENKLNKQTIHEYQINEQQCCQISDNN